MGTPPSTLVARTGSRPPSPTGYHLWVMGPAEFRTVALPAEGEVLVGRGNAVDVPLDDARASRRHARLRIGAEIAVEDLGSANGTFVRGRRLQARRSVTVLPGEAIGIGELVLMVQPNRSAGAGGGAPRILGHGEFQGRVEWECARAEATAAPFSVAHVLALAPAPAAGAAAAGLRPMDVVAEYGPGEHELLMPGLASDAAARLARALAKAAGAAATGVGIATYPEDGRHADALLAVARGRARGIDPARGGAAAALRDGDALDENMRRVLALAARAAAGDISLLILGETGVGKEVLARGIHASSARAARALVSVNCAALSETLLESELFGHERGAFTGAAQAKPGLLETAPGGTVFLDEVGELPLSLQAKLLRVIEAREIVRVGSVRPRKIDVRFIAATNRDLEAEVQRNAFRRDLFFRLAGLTLVVPPLRERPLDLPRLARQLVAELAEQAGLRRPPLLSEAALAALAGHGWPGNVRELRNVIERALLLCDGAAIAPAHLGLGATAALAPAPSPPVALAVAAPVARDGADAQAGGSERSRVLAALAACAGNQSRAARRLGISRKVLIARLDAYGVARPRKPVPK
jgi:transcriptional regulator with AAA-type ATPase domain